MADKPPSSGLCVVFARVVAKEGKADELEKLLQAAVKSANSDKEPYTKTYRCARHGGEVLFSCSRSSLFLVEQCERDAGCCHPRDTHRLVASSSVWVDIRPANSGSRGLSRTDCSYVSSSRAVQTSSVSLKSEWIPTRGSLSSVCRGACRVLTRRDLVSNRYDQDIEGGIKAHSTSQQKDPVMFR